MKHTKKRSCTCYQLQTLPPPFLTRTHTHHGHHAQWWQPAAARALWPLAWPKRTAARRAAPARQWPVVEVVKGTLGQLPLRSSIVLR
eukprot:1159697-Pelagomonas_calceolata.AAC.5